MPGIMLVQRRQFDFVQQQLEMNKVTRGYHRPQARSLLLDHKNKQAAQHSSKIGEPLKSKFSKPTARTRNSPSIPTRTNSLQSSQPSPRSAQSQPLLTLRENFSKSEEETKAERGEEQSQRTPGSPNISRAWVGVLGEYREEIMGYVLSREKEYKVDGRYLHHSHVLSAKMRVYLIRHIFKLYHRFDLLRTTLHLAVLYLDLYFSRQPYLSDQLQGIASAQACLFIAMKYEEIYPPDLRDWVDRHHRDDVLKIQAKILAVLNYQLSHYTIEHHLALQLWEKGEDIEDAESQVHLLTDLSLFDLNVRQLEGSRVAQAILGVGRGVQAGDHKVGLAVKWMVERNAESLHWLKQQKYGGNNSESCFF